MLLTLLGMIILKVIQRSQQSLKEIKINNKITGLSIVLFFALLFIWYGQVIEVPFNAGIGFISSTIRSLQDFFLMESRNTVPAAFGVGLAQKQLPHHIEFIFNWLTIIFMILGVVICWFKKSLLENQYLVKSPGREYLTLSTVSIVILVISVLFPMISVGYALDRIYLQMIAVLSLFTVIGVIYIVNRSKIKINPKWLLLVILIPYFWSQTSFTYQIMGAPRSMVLSTENEQYDLMYVLDSESRACSWLNKYIMDWEESIVYADFGGIDRLFSQAPFSKRGNLTAVETDQITEDDYIYLRNYNIAYKKLWYKRDFDYSEYKDKLINRNLVYSTAASAIYK